METIIPLSESQNGASNWPYVDTVRLKHYQVKCISNTIYCNKESDRFKGHKVQITLMDAESELFVNSISLYANFTENNRAFNGLKRVAKSKYQYTEYYRNQVEWFKTLIDENKITSTYSNKQKRQKLPTFYTCGLRMSHVRRSAETGCSIMIMDEDGKPKLFAIAVGDLRYTFELPKNAKVTSCAAEIGRVIVDIVDTIDYDSITDDLDFEDLSLDDLL